MGVLYLNNALLSLCITPIDTNLRFKVLILTSLVDKCVKYKETIFGSDGSDLNPFCAQNNPKSLKSDLYALTVLFSFGALQV